MIGQFQPEIGRRLSGHPINDKLVMAVNFASTDPIVTLAGVPKIQEDTGIAGPGSYTSGNVTYTQGRNRYGRWAGFSGLPPISWMSFRAVSALLTTDAVA